MGCAVILDPVDPPSALQLVQLCAVKAGQEGGGIGDGGLAGVGIVQGQAAQDLPVRREALAHGVRELTRQFFVDAANGLVKVADALEPGDVVGHAHVKVAEGVVQIHVIPSPSAHNAAQHAQEVAAGNAVNVRFGEAAAAKRVDEVQAIARICKLGCFVGDGVRVVLTEVAAEVEAAGHVLRAH